jgi:hypothetical protein
MASAEAVPRLVRQLTTLFLVTPEGDVWRVYDSDEPSGAARFAPTSNPSVRSRVFVGSGPQPIARIYLFRDGEPRSTAADRLYEQLSASTLET